MDMMQGFPPDAAGQVTLDNWRGAPFCHWAFHHVGEIVPSAEIANDPDNVSALERASDGLGDDLLTAAPGVATDALVVLHRGRIVHELYRNGMGPRDRHIIFSVSKSLLGLLAGVLEGRGQLDISAPITEYLPELADTAYAGATIRQALDMQVSVLWDEDYLTAEGPIIEYRKAANWNPLEPGETATDLRRFQSLLIESDGPHGRRFHYVSPVTDMLAWAFERASGVRYADLMSEAFLRPLGAERSGSITVDRIGGARAAGGVSLTARDLARVGQMMLQNGAREGVQVVPESWVADIWNGGDRTAWQNGGFADKFPGIDMSYRAKWYRIHGDAPMLRCLGIHGQYLFVDAKREAVIAWLGSNDLPLDEAREGLVSVAVQTILERLG